MAIVNTNAVVSIFPNALGETLPSASESTAGVIAVGKNLQIVDGRLTVKDVVTQDDLETFGKKKLLVDLGSEEFLELGSNDTNMGLTGILPISHGGTGATSPTLSRENLSVYSKVQTTNAINTAITSVDTKLTQDILANVTPLLIDTANLSLQLNALSAVTEAQHANAIQGLADTRTYIDQLVINANKGMNNFKTEVELQAFTPSEVNYTGYALDTKNTFIWDGSKWNGTGLSELELAKDFANSNALFKPVRLDGTVSVDSIHKEGIYNIPTDAVAKTLGLPDGVLGQLVCGGYTQPPTNGYVFHKLTNRLGDTYFNYFTEDGWTGWSRGGSRKIISNTAELNALASSIDELTKTENYFFGTGSIVTAAFGFPLTGYGCSLDIQANAVNTTCHQRIKSPSGAVHRFGTRNTSTNIWTWGTWNGFKQSEFNILDFASLAVVGKSTSKVVTLNTEFNSNIDNFFEDAEFYINNSTLASANNGFPITGSGGFFSSKINSSGAIIQKWQTYSGFAYRWGTVSTKVWQPWRGYTNATNAIIDIAKVQADKTKLVVYGSSTMWYLSDEMTDLATRYNLDFKNHGISGDTSYGAGQAQGSNVVTLQFTTGVITNGSNTPTIESSFGGVARHNRTVELSNGVKGTLRTDGTFVTSNLTANLTVSTTEKFRLYEYAWYDLGVGIYVIDIGKNDVSSTVDNSADILDRTLQIIKYIPKGSKILVGGHFSNTNSTDMHRTVVEKINEALRLKFGLRYFDINELLFDEATWTELGLIKTAEDITAIEQRRKPPSLSRDDGHLSEAMDKILARSIENKLLSLGYI